LEPGRWSHRRPSCTRSRTSGSLKREKWLSSSCRLSIDSRGASGAVGDDFIDGVPGDRGVRVRPGIYCGRSAPDAVFGERTLERDFTHVRR
jgi:hypothetical protein